MYDCYVTLSLTPSGLNLVNTLDIKKETLNFILIIGSNAENL
jgi:hypothetical protein